MVKIDEAVLITGASSGIGLEMARVFAEHGHGLILVARNQEKLQALADEIAHQHQVKVMVVPLDLSQPEAIGELFHRIEETGSSLSVLINNAGLGYVGFAHELDEAQNAEMIQVNVLALTNLCAAAAKHMIQQGSGVKTILNVASTGSFSPGPYTAVYYATKAYVLSFSEALRYELKPYKIQVKTLCPGATLTDFSKRAGKKEAAGAMSSRTVALAAYRGIKGRSSMIVPGFANKILIRLPKRWVSPLNFKHQMKLTLGGK